MPKFDRIDGQFVAVQCTFSERLIFKRAGWSVDTKIKRWATSDTEKARLVGQYAIGAAKAHLEAAEEIKAFTVAASWAEDTDAEYPAPKGLKYMPFQKAGIEYALLRSKTLISDPPGLGKALICNEKILTDSGWKRIGEAQVGDVIAGRNGFTKIVGVFPQGVRETLRVHFSDGGHIDCSSDHLWTVHCKYWKEKERTLTTKDMCESGLEYSGRPKFSLPLIEPVLHTDKNFVIPPYVLGYMLGNGYFGNCLRLTTPVAQQDVRDRISAEITLRCSVKWKPYSGRAAFDGRITKILPSNLPNPYLDSVRELGLYRELGNNKHIPSIYMFGSFSQRLDLLHGLMDSDGCADKGSNNVFYSTSKQLVEDVVEIVFSLGGCAKLREKKKRDGENIMYSTSVFLGDINPFWCVDKSRKLTPQNKYKGRKRFITLVETIEAQEQICIKVDAPDQLFLTTGYRATHNTVQAIGVHNARPCSSVLIICPASLKVNWSREWKRWDVYGLTVGIAMSIPRREPLYEEDGERMRNPDTGAPMSRTWTEHQWPDTDVVIINYDVLETYDDQIKAKHWDLVICDEAHLLKTETTVRSVCVFGGMRKVKVTMRNGKTRTTKVRVPPIMATCYLFLTGTPILSKPIELWTIVKACDPHGLGKSWERYTDEYCGAFEEAIGDTMRRVTDGASNLDRLNRLLRERFMVRRSKTTVLKELPPKTRELITLPADKLEKPVKKETTAFDNALASFETMMGVENTNPFRYIDELCAKLQAALDAQNSEEPNWAAAVQTLSAPEQIMFTEMSEAREEVALAKVPLVAEHVRSLVECEEPVILFAYHKSVVDALYERLTKSGLRVGVITGKVPPNKRQAVVDKFQDGELDVVIGNILAMGVGFTMTRARFVVFAELDWVPALIEQAEDRAWRNGQLNAVVVQHLVVDGSIEAMMAIRLLEKMGVIYEALDARFEEKMCMGEAA
jgi:hypothetical protein